MDGRNTMASMPLWRFLLFGIIFQGMLKGTSASDGNTTSASIVDSADILRILLNNSDPGVRPRVDGAPVVVRCSFYIVSFGPFNEVDMYQNMGFQDYRLDIYLRQTWVDPRLTFERVGDTENVIVAPKDIVHIWKPDLFFPNEKSASFHDVTVPNKLMRIYHNGTVLYSSRITLTLSCIMDLRRFPMDHQSCFVKIESYSYETKDMMLEWDSIEAVKHEEELDLPQFTLVSESNSKTTVVYKTGKFAVINIPHTLIKAIHGIFPALTVTFNLGRLYGFFILQTYVPTILIVILAWVSFWVNMDAVPARISLGVTTVLTMATQLSGSKASIPQVHYPKAIDIWMSMCMLFVFVSLVEYAFVNALSREPPKTEKEDEKNVDKPTAFPEGQFVGPCEIVHKEKTWSFKSGRDKAMFLERVSRICFPIAFFVFNVVYWGYYLRPY